MKSFAGKFLALCVLIVFHLAAFGQTAGDYRTTGAGLTGSAWSAASTWQRYNGSAWVAAPSALTGSGTITVQGADSINVDVTVTISGSLVNQGKLGTSANLTFGNGSTYEHAQNNGSLPVSTWLTGSTCKVTGYISGSKPNNANQNFYNLEWSCVGQTANVDMGISGADTIRGNLTIDTTGASSRVYLTSPTGYLNPINIMGNIYVRGGQFASNGSSSSATMVINTYGSIIVTGGLFGVSRGSGSDVTWNVHGDFSVTNAILQNSGGTHINKLAFAGTTTQNVTLTNVTYGTGTSYFTMEVESGAKVNLGNSVVSSSNSGSFIVLAGGTLATGNAGGLAGAIQCTGGSNGGGNSFSSGASYTFNGTAAQITSTVLPTAVNNLTINNPAGVTLSQSVTINGVLHLVAGVFNNTIPFTLGPGGSVSYEGGSLLVTSVDSKNGVTVPKYFYVNQNYPNPFNPSTTVEYGLPHDAAVTVKLFNLLGQEVATLFSGRESAGIHYVRVDGSKLGSGVYFYRVEAGTSLAIKRMVLVK